MRDVARYVNMPGLFIPSRYAQRFLSPNLDYSGGLFAEYDRNTGFFIVMLKPDFPVGFFSAEFFHEFFHEFFAKKLEQKAAA